MSRFYEGNRINLREAEVSDAEFILELRLNQDLTRFLNKIEDNLEKQRKYILDHQSKGEDFYFIVESKYKERYGTARIHDVTEDSFKCGSWILKPGIPAYVALENYFACFDYAFIALNKKHCELDVVKGNDSVINLHKKMGAKLINEDDRKFYFTFSRDVYLESRKKYEKYTLNRDHQINQLAVRK